MRTALMVFCLTSSLACQHASARRDPVEGVEFIPLPGVAPGEKDMFIGRGEVSVRAYRGCTAHGPCAKDPLERSALREGKEACTGGGADAELALNCVTGTEAAAFCKWLRGALPTVDEWERAARRSGEEAIIGGLADWTATPSKSAPAEREIRRGDWSGPEEVQRSWSGGSRPAEGFGVEVGFRCVQDVQ